MIDFTNQVIMPLGSRQLSHITVCRMNTIPHGTTFKFGNIM
jgi:hypothetical protein